MTSEISVFQNEELGSIRTTVIDGEPWFVGKDVAERLGYANPQKAVRDHIDGEDKTVNDSFTVNGTAVLLINESGLYSLILSSKLPKAKAFKRWVTNEVIPAIRKTGAYQTVNEDRLIRCAEIMAACLPENKPQVVKILGRIVPGLDGSENPKPTVTRCPEKFCNDRFAAYCNQHGYSNQDIAQMVGVSAGMPAKWKSGICSPSVENRNRLCAAMGLPEGHFDMKHRRKRP